MKSPSLFLATKLFTLGAACSAPQVQVHEAARPTSQNMTAASSSRLMKERRDMRERVLGSTMIAMLAEKYFTLVLPRMKDCVSQAGYDLALCEQEEVLPFVKEAEPSLDPSSLNALIHALHEKLLKEGLLEPPKRKEFPVDEDETVV